MKKSMFGILTGMLILSMIGFAVANEKSVVGASVNAQAKAAPSLSDSQDKTKSNTSEAKAQLNSSSRKTKEEKTAELKKQAEEKIAEARAKILESKENNKTAEKTIAQINQLLDEADKLFAKENYIAAIAIAKTALARLVMSKDKILENGEKILNNAEKRLGEREKILKEKEDKLKDWEGKLKQRIEKVESRLQELERFASIVEQRQGKLNVEGRNITIKRISREKREIIAGKINATLRLNITGEEIGDNMTTLAALLSNGKLSPVKIMPDRASLNALEKLKAKCEKEKCSVELKEVGNFEKSRAVYAVKTEKNSRIFFIFPKKMAVEAEVDAETGEVISISKPWWSFSAKETNAAEEEIKADVGEN